MVSASVTQPANGTVVITGGTGVTFAPEPGFVGATSFTYTLSDDHGGAATATVEVTVTAVNDPPSAVDDAAATPEDAALSIDVLANDSDVEGDGLTIVSVTQPEHGSVVITGGGTGLSFVPDPDFFGTISFTYTISDGQGGTTTATVTVIVISVNDAPVALDDTATVAEDAMATALDVLGNDSDVDGDALTIESVLQPAHGTVVITGGGSGLTFQPEPGFSGTTGFSYTVSDGEGGTITATVTITVTPGTHSVPVSDDTTTVPDGGGPTVIDVLDNDGNDLMITSVTQPAHGTVTIINGGTAILYEPDPGFTGTVTFMYTVSDGEGGMATATVTITVTASSAPDRDGDSVPDVVDNCPDDRNPDQVDFDLDGIGNACDPGFGNGVRVSGGGCQSSGGTSGALLLVLGWLAVARRRHRRAA
jgi:large repetitive protein